MATPNEWGDAPVTQAAAPQANEWGDAPVNQPGGKGQEEQQESGLSRFGHSFLNTIKGTLDAGRIIDPKAIVDTGSAILQGDYAGALHHAAQIPEMNHIVLSHIDQLKQAAADVKAGRYSEAAGHGLAALVPGLGPAAASETDKATGEPVMPPGQQVEQPRPPDIAGTAGDLTALAAMGMAPRVASGAASATRTAVGIASHPAMRDALGVLSPRAAHAAAIVGRVGSMVDAMTPEPPPIPPELPPQKPPPIPKDLPALKPPKVPARTASAPAAVPAPTELSREALENLIARSRRGFGDEPLSTPLPSSAVPAPAAPTGQAPPAPAEAAAPPTTASVPEDPYIRQEDGKPVMKAGTEAPDTPIIYDKARFNRIKASFVPTPSDLDVFDIMAGRRKVPSGGPADKVEIPIKDAEEIVNSAHGTEHDPLYVQRGEKPTSNLTKNQRAMAEYEARQKAQASGPIEPPAVGDTVELKDGTKGVIQQVMKDGTFRLKEE